MKKTLIAVGLGISLGAVTSFQLAGPVLAQSENDRKEIYEQLDLFGDIFDRIRIEGALRKLVSNQVRVFEMAGKYESVLG